MLKKFPLTLILILVFSSSYSQILTFDFQGNAGGEVTVNSNFNDATLGVSTISRGSGLVVAANNNSYNSINWSTVSVADAVTNNDYIEFTIPAITAGFSYDISTISFDIQRSNNGLTAIALRSSLDIYATNIDAEIILVDNNQQQNVTFNVSQFNNTSSITYRLYGYAENTNGSGRLDGPGNNIEVNGSINNLTPVSCLVSDDFSAASLGVEWTDVGGNASISNNNLEITTGSSVGLDYVFQDVSNAYNTVLSSLSNPITWEFNMRQSRGNPNGFNNNGFGSAFILGASDSDITEGNGYAVVLGQAGTTDNIRLISYTDGLDLDANLTDIITDATDYSNEYLSIRVIYDPVTNTWELFVRNDGLSFSNPFSLDASNSAGTSINTDFVNSSLNYIAAVWNHRNNANPTATFDNICISTSNVCSLITTWNGSIWSDGLPNKSTTVIINGSHNTGGVNSFSACNLIINSGTLTINNGDFVEVINDVIINNGRITTETQGSFVQRGNSSLAGSFTLGASGDSDVIKTTSNLANWFDYTYWSSPVTNATTDVALFLAEEDRRFWFNANNFIDTDGDGFDDDANAWTRAIGPLVMLPGQGFAATHNNLFFTAGFQYDYNFEGAYNTGDILYPVYYNSVNDVNLHWNLLGNPYPSAMNIDLFFTENTDLIYEAIYMWSQASPPLGTNPGNEVLNFNQNDYVTVNTVGEAGNGITATVPERRVPSGKSFFIPSRATGDIRYTNSMRVSGNNVNDQFFRTTNQDQQTPSTSIEKLWINLNSNAGIYSQICVAYADVATNDDDGKSIDTPRNYAGNAGVLYSLDEQGEGFYVIQGKAKSGLDEDEVLKLGFGAYISTNETYTLEAIKTQGDFLTTNTIYLRDNYEGIVHDLSSSFYTFQSDGGTFDDRFEIIFTNNLLSTEDILTNDNDLSIIELNDGNVQFTLKNSILNISKVDIYNIQGQLIYSLDGESSTETYNLSNLKSSIYIAKITLSNDQLITKKSIKK